MMKHNIKLRFIGRISELAPKVQERIQWAVDTTAKNSGTVLTLAVNYGGRGELADAFNAIAAEAAHHDKHKVPAIDEETISQHLYTSGMPDPDLIIRTSGEMRLSNFLLWQMAYSEIYVTPTFWPDFRGHNLLVAIEEYQGRERRYGGLGKA